MDERSFGVFGSSIVALCCMGLFLLVYVGSLIWVYNDAQKRGKTGCIWVLLVLVTWPLGLIAYYVVRDQDVRL